ncbi:MAG: 4-(cytidine 5'-diphospho)-2-C-methyl-D-erythritol kinase [Clostridia bacterium]|nr:4-(cytidine 5'-diphospho)-2-C-methyl-D-erythritol kinase [Clostridia bacterium]
MNQIYIKARAKINLTLEILNKREDNYHNLKSIFQKINLYDEIYIYKIDTDEFILDTNISGLDVKDNIIYKAYVKLKEKFDIISGIKVVLNKRIPMQAGLAGGSTDCASFILGMDKLFDLNLTGEQLVILGKSLGADVVPCLYNKAVLAEGIGEIITKIDTNFKYYIVVIKPELSCNTGKMFKKLDERDKILTIDNSKNVVKALEDNNIELLSNNLYNTFEEVLDLKPIKDELIKNKALGALLTGSGSCVYGIFKNKQDAKFAYNNLKDEYKTYICTSYNSLREEI